MDIIIKKEKINNEISMLLFNESFKLFTSLYNIETDNYFIRRCLKQDLINSYTSDIKDHKVYTAYYDDKLVGVSTINKDNYLQDLFVLEEYQRKGIGHFLLKEVIEDNINNGEITMDANPKYLDFYKKHLFEVVEVKDKTIRMKRSLVLN